MLIDFGDDSDESQMELDTAYMHANTEVTGDGFPEVDPPTEQC